MWIVWAVLFALFGGPVAPDAPPGCPPDRVVITGPGSIAIDCKP
ncbi:hypothetical protein Lfu02_62260 [Longispora fulva]|uniref:Uncharacterized protein n=1 Tax=Longispora fulva TaxID=619741 RepID=A0A8J7KIS4_9ACTN|nr:hypothetical protein [Longispora fulva]MBG6134646.1 hypothetical protein [Longispora fulva]GIG61854.1 hypothetical protein Lfu02_62260 [Longispora fulva]